MCCSLARKNSGKYPQQTTSLSKIKSTLYSRYYAKPCNEWRAPPLRLSAWATQERRSGGEPLATLCPIWPARELNPRPSAPVAMSSTTQTRWTKRGKTFGYLQHLTFRESHNLFKNLLTWLMRNFFEITHEQKLSCHRSYNFYCVLSDRNATFTLPTLSSFGEL